MNGQLVKGKISSANRLLSRQWYRACGRSEFTWRYVANFGPWLKYQGLRRPLDHAEDHLLTQLVKFGIVTTSVDQLLGNKLLFNELQSAAWRKEALLMNEILAARKNNESSVKSYYIPLLGRRPILNPEDIFVRFPLQPEIITIVNAYFGMLTRLRYFNVWHNVPTEKPPQESQLWHRDPEDRAVIKVFVYLTDVGGGSGPLSYAPGTHLYGDVRYSAPFNLYREGVDMVRRSTDEQMKSIVPESKWITAFGTRGTILLVDTRGYHKGGYVRESDRIVYVCAFTSAAAVCPDVFSRCARLPPISDRSVAFALHAGRSF